MPHGPAGRSPHPIAIAGAGIGGLAAALALAAGGFRVELFERAPKLSVVGAGIQITPNAGRVLARLGLDGAMAAAAIEPESIDVHNGVNGRRLATIPGAAFRQRYSFPYRVVHRADLQALLVDAVTHHADIRLHLGATVEGTAESADGIAVRLADGGAPLQAAALIAADGVRSSLRETLPGAGRAKPIGRTAWRAVVPASALGGLAATRSIGLWLGPGAHLVHYPVTQGKAVNIVAIVADDSTEMGWDAPGDPAGIARHTATWCEPARRLIATAETWRTFTLATVDPSGPWTNGRTALLGDAAHAMMPFLAQGAAMAIEDAAELAHVLGETTDVPAALRAYEGRRKPRVARVWHASLGTGEAYHFGAAMALARDAALSVAGRALILARNDWIYRWLPPAEAPSPYPMRASSFGR